jgi:biopolymer transport protein ExbD
MPGIYPSHRACQSRYKYSLYVHSTAHSTRKSKQEQIPIVPFLVVVLVAVNAYITAYSYYTFRLLTSLPKHHPINPYILSLSIHKYIHSTVHSSYSPIERTQSQAYSLEVGSVSQHSPSFLVPPAPFNKVRPHI